MPLLCQLLDCYPVCILLDVLNQELQICLIVLADNGATLRTSCIPCTHFAFYSQVQTAVIEAGLGGVTDATNVFEPANLACAVITAIDKDHLKALGKLAAVSLF